MLRISHAGLGLLAIIALIAPEGVAQGPSSSILKQDRDDAPAQSLTAAERATLGDPLFDLVLKEHGDLTNLAQLEDLIQPDPTKRQTFVVDENIADPRREVAPQQPQTRRCVLTFTGTNKGHVLSPNVMLSVFFDSQTFTDTPNDIEAWGWDSHRGRYNYYKLDRRGTPGGQLTWKFRISSDRADLATPSDRRGTCLACHINGAPAMKELSFPWNNWHSFKSEASYMTQTASPSVQWPVAASPRLASGRLTGAEQLETNGILPAITQFNIRRVNRSLAQDDAASNVAIDAEGFARVLEGKGLLRPLFFTTEYNVISAAQKSGLHPFPTVSTAGPSESIQVPATFFLNANIISGGTPAGYVGLGIQKGQSFAQVVRLTPAEYKLLVIDSAVQLGGRVPGDADFAWFVPEASHIDNDLVDRLMRRGVLTRELVAAVVAVDLEHPVLSKSRETLWQFVPSEFRFKPLVSDADVQQRRHPDELTKRMVAALEAANPTPGTPESQFLTLLKDPDPLKRLEEQIDAYLGRLKTALDVPGSREVELKRLQQLAIERRQAVLADGVLKRINETGNRLFPLP